MPDLKLARLPDRTLVKMSVLFMPELHHKLQEYAALYAESYGQEEAVSELIPAMLAAFLDGDRAFQKRLGARKDG